MSYNNGLNENFISSLKDRINIVDIVGQSVNLKKSGDNHMGLCPFHNEKTPSFVVNEKKQIYKCFGCGEGGDAISFLMKTQNMDFVDAVKRLCLDYNIDFPKNKDFSDEDKKKQELRNKVFDLHIDVAKIYRDYLLKNTDNSLEYLEKRGLSLKTIKQFGLGYAPAFDEVKNALMKAGYDEEVLIQSGIFKQKEDRIYSRFFKRVMFPIFDHKGRVIAFGGRVMDDYLPKYLNSPETIIYFKKDNLYGLNFAKKYDSKNLILVEGYMDVISLYNMGITGAIASLGTSLTKEQVILIKRLNKNIFISYDSDDAGQKATLRAIELLEEEQIEPYILNLGGYKDPDDFIKKEGIKSFNTALKNSDTALRYKLKIELKKYDINNYIQQNQYIQKACEIIKKSKNPIEMENEIIRISKQTKVSIKTIGQMVYGKYFSPRQFSSIGEEVHMKDENLRIEKAQKNELEDTLEEYFIRYPFLVKDILDKLKDIISGEVYERLKKMEGMQSENTKIDMEEKTVLNNLIKNLKIRHLVYILNQKQKLQDIKDCSMEEKINIAKEILDINKEIENIKKRNEFYV